MKFKVGDKVRVRNDLKMNVNYNGWMICNKKDCVWLGKEVTIKTATYHNIYKYIYTIEEDSTVSFNDDVLTEIESPTIVNGEAYI